MPRIITGTGRQSARMSKIKNYRLDQYGAKAFEQQQFETVGVEGLRQIKGTTAAP